MDNKKVSDSKNRIKELMTYYDLSQTDLCKRTGLQKSALSNYLSGSREPRQDQISLIVDPFNINPAWLMGYDVPMFLEPAALSSLRRDEVDLLNKYNSLNAAGKKEVHKYINMVADRDEYKLKGDASEHSVSAVG